MTERGAKLPMLGGLLKPINRSVKKFFEVVVNVITPNIMLMMTILVEFLNKDQIQKSCFQRKRQLKPLN